MQLTQLLDQLESVPISLGEPEPASPGRHASPEVTSGVFPCRQSDPELWFAERPEEVELAKALCRECPVLAGCLAGALQRSEPWGVWGGQLLVQGAIVARKRPRGRPRKDEVAA